MLTMRRDGNSSQLIARSGRRLQQRHHRAAASPIGRGVVTHILRTARSCSGDFVHAAREAILRDHDGTLWQMVWPIAAEAWCAALRIRTRVAPRLRPCLLLWRWLWPLVEPPIRCRVPLPQLAEGVEVCVGQPRYRVLVFCGEASDGTHLARIADGWRRWRRLGHRGRGWWRRRSAVYGR